MKHEDLTREEQIAVYLTANGWIQNEQGLWSEPIIENGVSKGPGPLTMTAEAAMRVAGERRAQVEKLVRDNPNAPPGWHGR